MGVLVSIFLIARFTSNPTSQSSYGQAIDGIQCQGMEQAAFHVHANLAIYANGSQRQVPGNIGIQSSCMYWLHTHDSGGIVHIESPEQRSFTLGNLFDIWGQPLGPSQVGQDRGKVVAYVNGKEFAGNPRDIPLTNRAEIQVDVGQPVVPPQPVAFPSGL